MILNLPNYYLSENLYQGTRTLVYRGQRNCDNKPVIIKVLRNPHPSFNELVQFRNQYIVTRHLEHPAIVQPLALERYGNSYLLVMPDSGAIALSEYWQKPDFSLTEFLNIAIQLAEALYYLTQQRIIHKDIKPSNILIHPETKQVQIIDFSISSLLPTEQQQLINPNLLEGTLAYISPEQTGRMNRGIDYRTDLYSLGVTFFELLTGELPFTTTDPMELLHCHIARRVEFRRETQLPKVVESIVLKLMGKNAEDRYQSALGLKHDLEKCLKQLETKGEITSFELGEMDRSDRFLIPEKLYGREMEVQTLLDAFERVSNPPQTPLGKGGEERAEMMLVAGFSGIGKTAVVNEVHKPIVKQRGYFIKGKYDQFNRNIPFSAFVQAFRDLVNQLLSESDVELANWKTKILKALGDNAQVIIEVVPELEKIIGKQPSAPQLSGSAAQNRFNLLFQKFIAVFTAAEHPVVMFLDDLQWADSASLNLMKVLMIGGKTGYLLLLGAYRDNEVFPAHPLMLSLAELKKEQAVISTITLQPLAINHINQLVADTLNCTQKLALPLSELVYQKTQGNPFFTTQFLKGLYKDELIRFNLKLGYWECDLVKVRDAALTDDVVEFVAHRLQKLLTATQQVLKLAACIGNQFDLQTLAVVCEKPEEDVAADIWGALQEGLILPISQSYKFFQGGVYETTTQSVAVSYRFLHDRVQQAAYSLIRSGQKQTTHLHIGRLLSQNLSQEQLDSNIFTIVNHWNQAIELIADPKERENLMQLNYSAGEKARGSAAYGAALKYFQTALSLLDAESWETNYPLALQLHENYAEVAYLTGDFELMETIIEQVIERGQDLLDVVKVHEIKIQAKMAQSQQLSALNIGIDFLALLGIEVPESPQEQDLQVELATIFQLIEGTAIAELANLPLMEDRKQLAKVNILANLLPTCFQVKPSLFPWVSCKLMQLSIQYGNTLHSSHIYSSYGMVCILALQDFTSATEYGKLACQLDLNPQTGHGFGTFATAVCISHLSTHVKESLPLLLKAYQAGVETGNFQFGGYAISYRSKHLYFMGDNLSTLKQEMASVSHTLATMKQENALAWNQAFEQGVLNLLGESETPWELIGTAYNETESVPFQISANDRTALHYVYLNKLILCYLFDNIPQAFSNAALAESYLDGVSASLDEYLWNFYYSLTQLANYGDADTSVQKSLLEKVETNQNKMQDWANHAPMNGQHKHDLVAAERHRVLGERFQAMDMYDRAIAGAKENEYLQEEALGNELAAKFYLEWGKEKVAAGYMQEAYYCYARWGAKAKTDDLEKRYPQLLQPILQQAFPFTNLLETLTTIAQPKLSIHSSQTVAHSSTTDINTTLDLVSVLKSSQALSEIIQLDRLLHQLIQIIMENSGGDRCFIIMPDENSTWQLRVTATTDSTELCAESLSDNTSLPVQLIQYVKNTQEVLVLNNLDTDLPIFDEYLNQNKPQSILCLPMLNQGKLVGILYLQNQLTSGVFTGERILILNFLCNQAAISIKNAQLHQKSEFSLQQVKQSQNLLRKIIDTVPQFIFWKDRDSNFLGCNQKFATMAGVNSPENIVGKTDYDLPWSREESDSFREYDRRVMESNQPELHIIETQKQIDGTTLWVDTNKMPLCDETGEVYGILGSYEDITERVQLEQEQKRLTAILEATSDYVGMANTQGTVLWMNAQFKKLRPELHSDGNSFKLTENHPQWANKIILNQGIPIAASHGSWFGETAVIDSTGREIPVSQIIIAHKSAEGVAEYFSTIMRNITQIKETETALKEKSQALEQALQDLQKTQLQMVQSEKMSALGNLMAGVAHEINNPIGFLEGNIQPAQEYVQDLLGLIDLYQSEYPQPTKVIAEEIEAIELEFIGEDLPKLLGSMNVGVERIRNISSSLRTFARKDQEHKTTFNIHEGIDSTLLILKHRTKATEKRPAIEIVRKYGDVPQVECFPGQLNQVFMNILANAIDAFDEATLGKTFAEIKQKPNRIMIETSILENNQLQIQIEDNGCGMKPETKERIFEQGFTTKGVGKGTGLGMAIAKSIITEKHDGIITCDSTVGEGTTFTIILPIV
ncbi:MAG: AAA family ATPase [Okeania sp. SIO2F4]|uniref:AAA family ATPase n=1 Tax=Okeania sp. SIO2F4 TaxID=2607790 RepID=UPI00142B8EA0|nr:AAA family ATPase [Okeania sp. SIO2F4]